MTDYKSKPSYREMREELDRLVLELESGELDIDTAIKTYEQAQKLIEQLEEYLRLSKNKITKLTASK